MSNTKILLLVSTLFLLSACTTNKKPIKKDGYYHSGIYFGLKLPKMQQRGIEDGCKTSKGVYTKSHELFKTQQQYVDGWFLGRNKCLKLLKINKNGDIISL